MAELRQSGLQPQRWVILSSARGDRPHDISDSRSSSRSICPFCRGHEHETGDETFAFRESDVVGAADWSVRVVYNKFPAVDASGGHQEGRFSGDSGGCCLKIPAFGSHEVVVETPEHGVQFADLSISQVELVLRAFRHRLLALRDDKRFEYVQVFKNNGKEAGASLRHSHSQIIALPMVPQEISWQVSKCKDYFDRNGSCIVCDCCVKDDGSRLIHQSSSFISIAPFAARFPFETWIVPLNHGSNFEEIGDSEIDDLARILQLTLKKMVKQLHDVPYNYVLFNNPFNQNINSSHYFHWYISILPRLGVLGGFELATGCNINTVSPEKAAELLRDCKVDDDVVDDTRSDDCFQI